MVRIAEFRHAANVTNQRRVQQEGQASSSDPVGAAISDTGSALHQFSMKMRDAQISTEVAEAQMSLRDRLDRTRREIEADTNGDPLEYEKRFRESAAAALTETGAGMTSPAHQRAWKAQADELVEDHSIRMRDVTRRRQLENGKAAAMRLDERFRDVANDLSLPQERLAEDHKTFIANMKRQYDAGLFTPDEYARIEIEAENVLKSGVSNRHLSNIDKMMTAGRYGEAEAYMKSAYDEIDPADRARAEKTVELQSFEGRAIQKADELFASGSYADAIKGVAEIENPKERLAVEDRIADLARQKEAGDAAEQQEVADGLLGHVLKGGGLSNAPAELLRRADAKTLNFIEDELYQRRQRAKADAALSKADKAVMKEESRNTRGWIEGQDWSVLSLGPKVWKEEYPDLYTEYQSMTDADQIALDTAVLKRRESSGAASSVDKAHKTVIDALSFYQPEGAEGVDFSGPSKSKGATRREEIAISGRTRALVEQRLQETGKSSLSDDDAAEIISRAYRDYDHYLQTRKKTGKFLGVFGGEFPEFDARAIDDQSPEPGSYMDTVARSRAETPAPFGADQSGPPTGTIRDGYRFRGGFPNDESNWEPVQ